MPDVDHGSALHCPRCRSSIGPDDAYCGECGLNLQPSIEMPGFRMIRLLGSGGAADVYLARQQALERDVAVKILRPGTDDDRSWRAFRHEAQVVARLSNHPNVVTVYTAGKTPDGRHYLVTEYLDQGSLDDIIATQGRLPPVEVAKMGFAISSALLAAHELGIHHRDVKPGNVLLGSGARIKLADFGIARLLAGRTVNTTDVVAYTPEHVAPEVLRSEPDGPWSDLYGLASTLATALTGSPPLHRAPDERMEAFLTRKLLAPAPSLPSDVPVELAEPIVAALSPDPRQRPTVERFHEAMQEAVWRLDSVFATAAAPPAEPGVTRAYPAVVPIPSAAPAAAAAGTSPLLDRRALSSQRRQWRAVGAALAIAVIVAGVIAAVALGDDGDDSAGSVPSSSVANSIVSVTTQPPVTAGVPLTTPVTTVAAPVTLPPTTASTTTTTTSSTTTTTTSSTTTTVPATTEPPGAVAPGSSIEPREAERFIDRYFKTVEEGDYETSWDQLAPEFKEGRELDFDEYVEFWDENDVRVSDIKVAGSDDQVVAVRARLRWNDAGPRETEEFLIRRGDDGELLIARQTSV